MALVKTRIPVPRSAAACAIVIHRPTIRPYRDSSYCSLRCFLLEFSFAFAECLSVHTLSRFPACTFVQRAPHATPPTTFAPPPPNRPKSRKSRETAVAQSRHRRRVERNVRRETTQPHTDRHHEYRRQRPRQGHPAAARLSPHPREPGPRAVLQGARAAD